MARTALGQWHAVAEMPAVLRPASRPILPSIAPCAPICASSVSYFVFMNSNWRLKGPGERASALRSSLGTSERAWTPRAPRYTRYSQFVMSAMARSGGNARRTRRLAAAAAAMMAAAFAAATLPTAAAAANMEPLVLESFSVSIFVVDVPRLSSPRSAKEHATLSFDLGRTCPSSRPRPQLLMPGFCAGAHFDVPSDKFSGNLIYHLQTDYNHTAFLETDYQDCIRQREGDSISGVNITERLERCQSERQQWDELLSLGPLQYSCDDNPFRQAEFCTASWELPEPWSAAVATHSISTFVPTHS